MPLFIVLLFLLSTVFVVSNSFVDSTLQGKLYYFYVVASVLLVGIRVVNILRKKQFTYRLSVADGFLFIYTLLSFVSVLCTQKTFWFNETLLTLLLLVGFYFTVKNLFTSSFSVIYIVIPILFCGGLESVYGILQYLKVVSVPIESVFKLSGSFVNSGEYANYLSAIVPFSLGVFLFGKELNLHLWFKRISLFVAVVGTIAIVLTLARTSYIALVISVLVLLNTRYQWFQKFRKVILIVVSLIVIVSSFALYKVKKDSAIGRVLVWEVSSQLFIKQPITGIGFGRFGIEYNDYQANYFSTHPNEKAKMWVADNTKVAFNEFLQIAIEMGIVGLLFFILFIVVVIKSPNETPIHFLSKVSLLSILICGLFSYPFHSLSTFILFFLYSAIGSTTLKHSNFNSSFSLSILSTLLFAIVISGFVVFEYRKMRSEIAWKTAVDEPFDKTQYEKLYSLLQNNGIFLYNYGCRLQEENQFSESIQVLEKSRKYFNDNDLYVYLGLSYKNIKQFEKAEQNLLHASHITPTKFYPKYELVQLYLETHQKAKALTLAREIVNSEIKIINSTSVTIQEEMKELLEKK